MTIIIDTPGLFVFDKSQPQPASWALGMGAVVQASGAAIKP